MVKTPRVIKTTRVYKVIQKSQCERRRPRSAHWGMTAGRGSESSLQIKDRFNEPEENRLTEVKTLEDIKEGTHQKVRCISRKLKEDCLFWKKKLRRYSCILVFLYIER